MRLFARAFVVISAGLLTWLATGSLIAQQAKKRSSASHVAASTSALALSKTGVTLPTGGPLPPISLPEGAILRPDLTPMATFALETFDVSVLGNQVAISAGAAITDRRDELSYVWVLKAIPANGGETRKNVYDHQIFRVAPDVRATPTFQEKISLPPGTHVVELFLHGFRTGTDLGFLDDEAKVRGSQLLLGRRKIQVN